MALDVLREIFYRESSNPQVNFLRRTAKKLHTKIRDNQTPSEEWKAAILCYGEFLVLSDEIEGVPKIKEQVAPLPKARPPQREFVVSAEVKFQPHVEAIIAPRLAPKHIEPLRTEQRKQVLILKDLPRKKSLILKDLENQESVNVSQVEEKASIAKIPSKSLKTNEGVRKPERAPRIEKEEEISLLRLVKLQRGLCAYCFQHFGDRVFSTRKIVTLHATREHFVPESMGGNIIFAACQMCNFFKRDYLFKTIAQCRQHLSEMWKRSGYKNARGHFIASGAMFSKN
jgi:hypothetical protein